MANVTKMFNTTTDEHKRRDALVKTIADLQRENETLLKNLTGLQESSNIALGVRRFVAAFDSYNATIDYDDVAVVREWSNLLDARKAINPLAFESTERLKAFACIDKLRADAEQERDAEFKRAGNQATEIDRLRNALNGELKVGKRRKQLMRALGMQTSMASEHTPTWNQLLEKVERLGTDAATNGAKSETTVSCGDPNCWCCGLDQPKPNAIEAMPFNGVVVYRGGTRHPVEVPVCAGGQPPRSGVEAPPVEPADPGKPSSVPGATSRKQPSTATLERDDEPIPFRLTGKARKLADPNNACGDCKHVDKPIFEPPCDRCALSDDSIGWKPADDCPLPVVGEWEWKWPWTGSDGRPVQGSSTVDSDHSMLVLSANGVIHDDELWHWDVAIWDDERTPDGLASGITKTRKGAMRAAERSARRAWKIRHGRIAT